MSRLLFIIGGLLACFPFLSEPGLNLSYLLVPFIGCACCLVSGALMVK